MQKLVQSVYELDYQQTGTSAAGSSTGSGIRAWWSGVGLSGLFHLGMRHIAERTDYLLFLPALLLPAPLLAVGACWAATATVRQRLLHILGIVTAFTIGHSLTLTLAAMNFVHVPSRPVEVLIAMSILVSTVHALGPTFLGKEAWIAASFGLIHGLAFASTLDLLGLARWDRVAGILSFNLGIETMQLLNALTGSVAVLAFDPSIPGRYAHTPGSGTEKLGFHRTCSHRFGHYFL